MSNVPEVPEVPEVHEVVVLDKVFYLKGELSIFSYDGLDRLRKLNLSDQNAVKKVLSDWKVAKWAQETGPSMLFTDDVLDIAHYIPPEIIDYVIEKLTSQLPSEGEGTREGTSLMSSVKSFFTSFLTSPR